MWKERERKREEIRYSGKGDQPRILAVSHGVWRMEYGVRSTEYISLVCVCI